MCAGRTVLDLCCYTGGFAIQAKRLGNATEVTAVDLDEKAIAIARDNARLNQQKVNFVHADVFGYMRDMIANGRTFDVVVLDPPKLIRNRRELDEGRHRRIVEEEESSPQRHGGHRGGHREFKSEICDFKSGICDLTGLIYAQ